MLMFLGKYDSDLEEDSMEAFINWKRDCGALAIKGYIEGPLEKKWFRIYI